MPLPIQTPKVSSAIHDFFKIVGRYRPQVDEVVVPTVTVGDVSMDTAPLIRRAVDHIFIAAVALERPTWRFEVPAGTFAVVEQWFLPDDPSAGDVEVFFGSSFPAPATLSTNVAFVDGRLRERQEAPAGRIAFGTQVAGLAVSNTVYDRTTIFPPIARIPGGWTVGRTNAVDFIEFQLNAVNVNLSFAMQWREVQPF